MADYQQLAKIFGRVRRAWKRTAALQGLAIVAMESIGVFVLLVMFNYFYGETLIARYLGVIAALGVVIYLFLRHVMRPLLRKISDDQIALYIEEHNEHFEGALISGAEFGVDEKGANHDMVEAIVASAVSRAKKVNLSSVIELKRLKKYGVAAIAIVVVYLGLNIVFPESLGSKAIRTLALESAKPEEPEPLTHAQLRVRPIKFMLSHENARLPSGGRLELEALLSRAPDEEVELKFRPVTEADGEWRGIKMREIEKVHGYSAALEDINQDLEYYVSAEKYQSPAYRVTVFEPLRLESYEITTTFPPQYNFPPLKESQAAGDVDAIEGSSVQVRVLTNRPLEKGSVLWADGRKEPVTIKETDQNVASFSFELQKETSYRIELQDIDAQIVAPQEDMFVIVRKDQPPKVEMTFPLAPVSLVTLSELDVNVRATDDYGLDQAELVYMIGPENPEEYRMPIDVPQIKEMPNGSEREIPLATTLALETLERKVKPGDVITFYIEVVDKKGWKAISKMGTAGVIKYENWSTILDIQLPEMEPGPDLTGYFEVAWVLHSQKDILPEADFKRQATELNQSMVDGATQQLLVFAKPKEENPPHVNAALEKIQKRIAKGHAALLKPETLVTINEWRMALMEMQAMGLLESEMTLLDQTFEFDPELSQEEMVKKFEQFQAEAEEIDTGEPLEQEEDLKEAAEEIAQDTEEIEMKQEHLIDEAQKELEKEKAKPEEQANKEEQEKKNEEFAEKQKELAKEVKEVAKKIEEKVTDDKQINAAMDKLKEAAKLMTKASQEFKKGEKEEAIEDAKEANDKITQVKEELRGKHREKIAQDIAKLIKETMQIQAKQKDLKKKTEEMAENKEDPKKDPKLQRDFRKMTYDQIKLKAELKKVETKLDKLSEDAKKNLKPETSKKVEEAVRNMKRKRVDQRMSDAIVDLNEHNAKYAARSQEKAEKGLDKVVAELKQASDTMASDPNSELRRARDEAKRIAEKLEQLDKKKQKPDEPELKPQDRKEVAEDTAFETKLLAEHLEQRDFAAKEDRELLKEKTKELDQFRGKIEKDEKERDELKRVVKRVYDRLEAEYQSRLKARKLFAAQREECPPQYRDFVNKYYESLSQKK